MGVILNLEQPAGCKLGIWEIRESYEDLRSKLSLETEEVRTLESFRNNNRKLEWMSVRTLASEMAGKPSRIVYNAERKPFLLNNSCHISISHSHRFTAILMSRFKRVGVDLEYMSHKISRIAQRFINDSEKITENPDLRKYHLYIHWCAKEALYKICDKQGINFKKNLRIAPFNPMDKGTLTGTVDNISGTDTYPLQYIRMDNYIIVWCCR